MPEFTETHRETLERAVALASQPPTRQITAIDAALAEIDRLRQELDVLRAYGEDREVELRVVLARLVECGGAK